MSDVENKKESNGRVRAIVIFLCIIVVVLLTASGYFYWQYHTSQQMLKNPSAALQNEAEELVNKVSKLMILPKDDQPTIATVADIKKLQGQVFFKNAKNGDKVLIYSKTKKAILYDPTANKIIEVAPLNLVQPTAVVGSTVSPAIARVALYNGAGTVGLTTKAEKNIQAQLKNVQVAMKENASKNTYEKTIVVDLTGKNTAIAAQLAKVLTGERGELPVGEAKPSNIDIIIILGKTGQ